MEANHIRLGNLFLGFDNQVFEWKLFHFGLLSDGIELDEIIKEPIQITEEWLLSVGFKRTIYSKDSGYKQYGIHQDGFDFMFSLEVNEKPEFYLSKIRVKIEYVHEIQNLYFSLKNEELIKSE